MIQPPTEIGRSKVDHRFLRQVSFKRTLSESETTDDREDLSDFHSSRHLTVPVVHNVGDGMELRGGQFWTGRNMAMTD